MCLILYVLAFWTFHGNKKCLIFFNFIKTFFQTQKDVNWTHTVSRKWRTKIAGHVTHVLTGILVSDWPERQRPKCSVSTNDHTWWHCTRPHPSAPGPWQAWAGGGGGEAVHGWPWLQMANFRYTQSSIRDGPIIIQYSLYSQHFYMVHTIE